MANKKPQNVTLQVLLPYDVYVAAQLFLHTGRSEAEVLPLIHLQPDEWQQLSEAYFDLLHGNMWKLEELFPGRSKEELLTMLIGGEQKAAGFGLTDLTERIDAAIKTMGIEDGYLRWGTGEYGPEDIALAIRRKVLENPNIGPFADTGWTAVFIMRDPEAWLCYYSHDGKRIYLKGAPLTDKGGVPYDVDPATFRHLGGRWYSMNHRIYGQSSSNYRLYFWEAEGADPASFKALNMRYAKDKNVAWYITGKKIKTKSPDAFEIIAHYRKNWRTREIDEIESWVARDREKVYSYGAAVRRADPVRFRNLLSIYWTDEEHIWIENGKVLLEDADAASFRVPGFDDPHVNSSHSATDRFRSYVYGRPDGPRERFEDWRAYFEGHPELQDYWWWQMERQREGH